MSTSLNFDALLTEAIANLGSEFRQDELAYLATTTKVELPFRDRLAFKLHQRCAEHDLFVARELSRIDIGIIDGAGIPTCLIELKAMYSFDALKAPHKFTDATAEDERKARRLAGTSAATSVYSLLLVTHLSSAVAPQFRRLIKYATGINGAISRSDALTVETKSVAVLNSRLSHRNVVTSGKLNAGDAFGMNVAILYWLVRDSFES